MDSFKITRPSAVFLERQESANVRGMFVVTLLINDIIQIPIQNNSFQWNLVCDSSWWISTGDSAFMIGVMMGSMIFGYLSDKFGRKPTFIICLLIQLLSGVIVGIAPNFPTFVAFRAILGSTTSGVFIVAYVIGNHS